MDSKKQINGITTSHIPLYTSNKGITLIALVITIIILLILAGVTINMVLGEDGIIAQAQQAKTETGKKQVEEKLKLAIIAATTGGKGKLEEGKLQEELESTFGENGYEITGDATKGWTVTVPKTNGEKYNIGLDGQIKEYEKKWTQNGDEITRGTTTIHVGDVVNYTPTVRTEGYTVYAEDSGYDENQPIYVPEGLTWKVLGVNEEGKIEIIPTTITNQVNLKGMTGAVNADKVVSDICLNLYSDNTNSQGKLLTSSLIGYYFKNDPSQSSVENNMLFGLFSDEVADDVYTGEGYQESSGFIFLKHGYRIAKIPGGWDYRSDRQYISIKSWS